ncbi:MAG: hypothetical protein HOV86_08645 [Thermoactinospora sp.]|nr:hypothetical protein [Thermoactinospora sp.]
MLPELVDIDLSPPAGVPLQKVRRLASLARWRPRTRRARLVLAAVIVAVVLGTGAVLWTGQEVVYTPDAPVRAWFDVLARRDTAAARDLAGGVAVLADDGLASGYEPPTGLQIGEITYGTPTDVMRRPNKSIAYVTVRYQVGGQQVEGSIEVVREKSGPVRPWSLSDGITGPLYVVSPVVEQARVAGTTVHTVDQVRASGTSDAVWVPPGVYTVTAAADDPLFDSRPVTVPVLAGHQHPDKATSVNLALTARPDAVAVINKQIKAVIDDCAKRDDLNPIGCPFGYSGLDTIGASGVHWKITKYPQITLTPAENQYVSGGLADVVTVTPGQASATFERGRESGTRTVDISPGGAVRVLADLSLCWNQNSSALACADME